MRHSAFRMQAQSKKGRRTRKNSERREKGAPPKDMIKGWDHRLPASMTDMKNRTRRSPLRICGGPSAHHGDALPVLFLSKGTKPTHQARTDPKPSSRSDRAVPTRHMSEPSPNLRDPPEVPKQMSSLILAGPAGPDIPSPMSINKLQQGNPGPINNRPVIDKQKSVSLRNL